MGFYPEETMGDDDTNEESLEAPGTETSSTGPTPLMSIRTPTQVQAAVHHQKEKERIMSIPYQLFVFDMESLSKE